MKKGVTFAICGCGQRGLMSYAPYALQFPNEMRVVAGADPLPERLKMLQEDYQVQPEMCFPNADAMLACERLADVMIISTQDREHTKYAIAALEKGYHLLLEKPISPELSECNAVKEAAHRAKRMVIVCHVLRYTPFYSTIKRLLEENEIGKLHAIDAVENIGYWHFAHSYVRGNWRNSATASPMILAKSCHDMDILRWLAGEKCESLSSIGSLSHFKKQNAPEQSAEYCMQGCQAKESCPYDAEKIYLRHKTRGVLQGNTGWPCNVLVNKPTAKAVAAAIQDGPYGRCVYRCDNNVVDHQSVLLSFGNDITATFTVTGFTQDCHRTIKLMGSMGEIEGDMDTNTIWLRRFGREDEKMTLTVQDEGHAGHGGGDFAMMREVCRLISEQCNEALTSVDISVESHAMALAAEYSRLHAGEKIMMCDFEKN